MNEQDDKTNAQDNFTDTVRQLMEQVMNPEADDAARDAADRADDAESEDIESSYDIEAGAQVLAEFADELTKKASQLKRSNMKENDFQESLHLLDASCWIRLEARLERRLAVICRVLERIEDKL